MELATLLRDLRLKDVTNADILYFMVRDLTVLLQILHLLLGDMGFWCCKLYCLKPAIQLPPIMLRIGKLKSFGLPGLSTTFTLPIPIVLHPQALMDADGNGKVSQSELLSSAKIIADTATHMRGGGGKVPQVCDVHLPVPLYLTGIATLLTVL
jgi:hypothetical protein